MALNIGEGEELVGIEILDAQEVLGFDKVPAVRLEGLASSAVPIAARKKRAK